MRGTDAGFLAGHSNGCTCAERVKQRRLQNLAGHAEDKLDEEHAVIKGESPSGVVQNAHAADFICRSKISLCSQGNSTSARKSTEKKIRHTIPEQQ